MQFLYSSSKFGLHFIVVQKNSSLLSNPNGAVGYSIQRSSINLQPCPLNWKPVATPLLLKLKRLKSVEIHHHGYK